MAKEKSNDAGQAASNASPAGKRDRLITGLLGVAALLSIMTLGVIASRYAGSTPSGADQILRLASTQFIDGQVIVAGKLAETIDLGPEETLPPDLTLTDGEDAIEAPIEDGELGEDGELSEFANPKASDNPRVLQQFLVGMGKIAQAALATDAKVVRGLRREGVDSLLKSSAKGFPPGRAMQGNKALGQTLVNLGRYGEAIEPLAEVIRLDPTLRRDVMPIYAEALRKSETPDAEKSLSVITDFLKIASLPLADRAQGRGIELRTLVQTRRDELASERIAEIESEMSAVTKALQPAEVELLQLSRLLAGEVLVNQSADRLQRLSSPVQSPGDIEDPALLALVRKAVTQLSDVVRLSSPRAAMEARLALARLYRLVGDDDRALLQLTEARQQRPLRSIGILAGLEEMELLGRTGAGDELTSTLGYLIREIEDPAGFDATELTFEDFRRRTLLAIQDLHEFGQYESALSASSMLTPLFGQTDAMIGRGRAQLAWAEATESLGRGVVADRQTAALARARYRSAGAAFAAAAEASFGTSSYVETQWAAVDAYQKGRHFTESIRLLKPYLRYVDRRRSSRGLLAMGRALLTEGRVEEAIEFLTTCLVEQPRDPLRYDARLWMAKAYRELRQPEQAKRYLLENLRDGALTPQSPAWRESLFAIGDMMKDEAVRPLLTTREFDAQALPPGPKRNEHRQLIEQTIRYLDEAVDRAWPTPPALSAIYGSAMTDRAAAILDLVDAEEPNVTASAKRALVNQSDDHLRSASAKLQRLANHLISIEDDRRLVPKLSNMLRNALMLRGDVLRDMKDFESASQAYQMVEQRYVHTPTSLEAIMRRSESLRQIGRREQADLLIRQARATLQRINPSLDEQFARVSRYDRRGWEDYLGWLGERLDQSS